ncbi:MAG: hypothetical protein L7F78_06600 [Syntrophales bacterium LBB04]|nr:hypothetical protein [Syntrophales bacterium LBB04]
MNHAALFLGDGKVGEVIPDGVISRNLAISVTDSDWVLVRRLANAPADMIPVLDCANSYFKQGNRYAYEQIVLLAFLCLTRKLTVTPIVHYFIQAVLDNAAAMLTRFTSIATNREPMICSEFVYRSYDEALPERKDIYSLGITPESTLKPALRAAPTARSTTRSRGIHPESLLGLMMSEQNRGRSLAALQPPKGIIQAQAVGDASRVDALIEQYLEEAQQKIRTSAETVVTIEDMRAVHNFSRSLYAMREPTARAAGVTSCAFTVQSPEIDCLLETVADFVTPGDLLKTQSLTYKGILVVE